MLVGFAAGGLHQVVFHPLFVAPFVLSLWFARRWRLAAAYTLAYAAIGLFWIFYPSLIAPSAGEAGQEGALQGFVTKVTALLFADVSTAAFMLHNLARFVAWQNPFEIVLLGVALFACRKWPKPLPQLAAGVALTIVVVVVVMPFQGYGWGYRYVHGLLGSFSLIAAYGWIALTGEDAARGRAAFAACTAFALLMLPLRAWQAYSFSHPYAAVAQAIRTTDADLLFLDPTAIWYGAHLVRNDPALGERPKMMLLNLLGADDVRALCAQNSVAMFDYAVAKRFGIKVAPDLPTDGETHNARMRALMSDTGCGNAPVGGGR